MSTRRPQKSSAASHHRAPRGMRAEFADVILIPTKGTKNRGGGPDGESWRIEFEGRRAGIIFINLINQLPLGQHASIQIYLNIASRSRHIGRIAYRKACESSRYEIIFAHMRKSNAASIRAAEEAGFVDATRSGDRQTVMVWKRDYTLSLPRPAED